MSAICDQALCRMSFKRSISRCSRQTGSQANRTTSRMMPSLCWRDGWSPCCDTDCLPFVVRARVERTDALIAHSSNPARVRRVSPTAALVVGDDPMQLIDPAGIGRVGGQRGSRLGTPMTWPEQPRHPVPEIRTTPEMNWEASAVCIKDLGQVRLHVGVKPVISSDGVGNVSPAVQVFPPAHTTSSAAVVPAGSSG